MGPAPSFPMHSSHVNCQPCWLSPLVVVVSVWPNRTGSWRTPRWQDETNKCLSIWLSERVLCWIFHPGVTILRGRRTLHSEVSNTLDLTTYTDWQNPHCTRQHCSHREQDTQNLWLEQQKWSHCVCHHLLAHWFLGWLSPNSPRYHLFHARRYPV